MLTAKHFITVTCNILFIFHFERDKKKKTGLKKKKNLDSTINHVSHLPGIAAAQGATPTPSVGTSASSIPNTTLPPELNTEV